MEEPKRLTAGILFSLVSALLMSTFFLFYKVVLAECMNHSLEQENGMLLREIQVMEREQRQRKENEKEES